MEKNALYDTGKLIFDFLKQDDLKRLAAETGALLNNCPLLVLDDTFRIVAHFSPPDFNDRVFCDAVSCGEITYEAGTVISKSPALCAGAADYIKLDESPLLRRFAPLINCNIRLGYLICVDYRGELQKIPKEVWEKVEAILAKQLFIEACRQGRPFETADEILIRLLDGGFTSAAYFKLQINGSHLANFHPYAFSLIYIAEYNTHSGKPHLHDELKLQFPGCRSFIYKGNIFLFLNSRQDISALCRFAKASGLKIAVSDSIGDLYELPKLYGVTHDALEIIVENDLKENVYTVEQLRTPLILKKFNDETDMILPSLRELDKHDREKSTEYCETLYYYLSCGRSLKKTCSLLFSHRNTVLYRIHRMQDDFEIPLDDDRMYMPLLIGTAILLLKRNGADFFLTDC